MDITAKSLVLTAPRRLEWTREQLADPAPGMVVVQTVAGAISIGSELPQYAGKARGAEPPRYPRMTGYESVGVVVAIGEGVERLQVGERVVAFYGHRTAALVPASTAIRVPEGISDLLALLTILTCDAAKGVRKITPLPEEPVLVTGAGAIGLFVLCILKAYGSAAVDVVEPDERRHALARALGARMVLRPAEAATGAAEYPAGFECSARNEAFALLQRRLAPHGRLCVLSDGNVEPLTLTAAFHEKELRVVGS
ncbi:MAG TPA: zinc-binding alcohol dehydrogenase, partial [Ktedonobacterales bacterium]|nr:zinc-binding alcohol dehydrogenase [Ktedonobacterales bacterium]